MIDKRAVFEKVRDHLLSQMQRAERILSAKHAVCMYRYEGRKCALGCLIPDELYDPKIEQSQIFQETASGDLLRSILARALGVAELDHGDKTFLDQLQRIHDSEYPRNWRPALEKFARQEGLSGTQS